MKRLALLLPLLALAAGCRTGSQPSWSASPEKRLDALAAAAFDAPDETVVFDELFFDRPSHEGYPTIVFSVVRGQRAPVAVSRAADDPDGTLRIDLAEGTPLAHRLEAARPLDPERKRKALLDIRAEALALAADPGTGAVGRTLRDWILFGDAEPLRRAAPCLVHFVESDEPPRIVVRRLTPASGREPVHAIRVPAASPAAHDIARYVARDAPWDWPDGAHGPGSAVVAGRSGVREWTRFVPLERGEDGVLRTPSAIRLLEQSILSRIVLARKTPPNAPALRIETVPAPPPDGPDERLSFELGASFVELPRAEAEEFGIEGLLVESYERTDKAPAEAGASGRRGCRPPGAPDPGIPVRHGDADHTGYAILSPPEMHVLHNALARPAESCVEGWTEVREGDLVRFAAPDVALDVSIRKPGGRRGLAIEPYLAVELDPSAPLAAPPPADCGLYSASTVAVFLPGGDERPVRLLFLAVREIGGESAYSLDAALAAPADFAGLARLLAAEVRAESPPGEDAAELRDDLFPLDPVEPDAPLEDADWKRIFAACGVDWPNGSFVHQMVRAHANFLTVRNTAPALRHVRRVLDALGNDQSRAARLLATLGSAEDEHHAESAEPRSHAESAESAED